MTDETPEITEEEIEVVDNSTTEVSTDTSPEDKA